MKQSCSVDGCERQPYSHSGLCSMHHQRMRKWGDPTYTAKPYSERGASRRWLQERLSDPGDECLIWPFWRDHNGRARISMGGKSALTCRYICSLSHGDAPTPRHEAAHSCGNGHLGCVNPRHISWKTPKENARDKLVHGTAPRGERNGQAKMTNSFVRRLREERPRRREDIERKAMEAGVAVTTIKDVLANRTWVYI